MSTRKPSTAESICFRALVLFVGVISLAAPQPLFAWAIYNYSSHGVWVKIFDVEGGNTQCGDWDSQDGYYVAPISETGVSPGPNWSDKDCNPSEKRWGTMGVQIVGDSGSETDPSEEEGRFMCKLFGLAGGYILIYDQDRPGFDDEGDIRDNRYCVSRFAEYTDIDHLDCSKPNDKDWDNSGSCSDIMLDYTDTYARGSRPEDLAAMTPANRNVRFLATGDPQFWGTHITNGGNTGVNKTAEETMRTMILELSGEPNREIRGIVVTGDLAQYAKTDELQAYQDSLLGLDRYVYEGLGNHDIEPHLNESKPELYRDYVGLKARNTWPTKRNYGDDGNEIPHYSWDWHDIHMVQLNLFPGDDPPTGAANQPGLNPRDALQFLKDDLLENVGTTGRPVILFHHYGFESFSRSWWLDSQREAYWDAIADYNVIAIITGHSHGYAFDDQPGGATTFDSSWVRTSGWTTRPDGKISLRTFIAGAARGGGYSDFLDDGISTNDLKCDDDVNPCLNGVYLDIVIDNCDQMIVTRKDIAGDPIPGETPSVVDFVAPGTIHPDCNTPPMADAGGPYIADEGSTVTFDGSGSSDADGESLEYRWDFDGDGNFDTGWSNQDTEAFTWDNEYSGDIVLEVRDSSIFQAVGQDTTTVTINNAKPVISAINGDVIDENGTATVSGDFSDTGVNDSFTVTIDWGEGSPVDYAYPAGSTSFSETHQYLDDNPSNTGTDDYTVTATVTDDSGAVSDPANTTVTVNNVAPLIETFSVTPAIDENGSVTLNMTWSDVGTQDTFIVELAWGDGGAEVIGDNTGGTSLNWSHKYRDDDPTGSPSDSYTVSVTVKDDDGGGSTTQTATVTVNNVPPVIESLLVTPVIDENGTVTLNVGWSDIGKDDTYVVVMNWGDGGIEVIGDNTSGTSLNWSHKYRDDDPSGTPTDTYTITVTVEDDDGGTDVDTFDVTVNNVAPQITAITGDAIDENGTAEVSGTFTDSGKDDTFTVTIDWGEGEPVDYSYPAGSTGFSETHLYLDDDPTGTASDSYTVEVMVSDDDGGSHSDSTLVTVSNLAPVISSVTGDVIDENGTATVSGSFSDVGTEDSFTVTIDWGEGAPVDYSYPAGSTGFSETHQYLDDNPSATASDVYTVTVTVTDDDTGSDSDSTSVTVHNISPVLGIDQLTDDLTGLTLAFVNEDGISVPGDIDVLLAGSSFTLSASYSDTGTQDTHNAEVDWDDGAVEAVSITTPGATDDIEHDYAVDATPGAYLIALSLTDDDLGADLSSAEVEVVDAAGALADALGDLQGLIDAGGLDGETQAALEKTMSFVTGNLDGDLDGDGDGDAENGALDRLEAEEFNAALVQIAAAIEELLVAEAADPTLDLTAAKAQLALTARLVASNAIELVAALPQQNPVPRKLAEAQAWLADGDLALNAGDHLHAAESYQEATKAIQSLL